MSKQDLNPCPFCGAQPVFPEVKDVFGTCYEAGCEDCQIATMSMQIIDSFDHEQSPTRAEVHESWCEESIQYGAAFIAIVRQEAITEWNDRHLSQPVRDRGWNDAIRAALAVLDSNPDESLTGQSLFRAVAQHEAIYNLIDQQPKPKHPTNWDDTAKALVRAASVDQPTEPDWRDMESAPRDGTRVRLRYTAAEIDKAVWDEDFKTNGRWYEDGDDESQLTEVPQSFGTALGWMPLPGDPK